MVSNFLFTLLRASAQSFSHSCPLVVFVVPSVDPRECSGMPVLCMYARQRTISQESCHQMTERLQTQNAKETKVLVHSAYMLTSKGKQQG